jgi:hypothetical protein
MHLTDYFAFSALIIFLWRFGLYCGHGLSFHGGSRYHSDTLKSVGLIQTSDQTLSPQPKKHTTHRYPCPR